MIRRRDLPHGLLVTHALRINQCLVQRKQRLAQTRKPLPILAALTLRTSQNHTSSFASMVMFALSKREIGHPAFAAFAISKTLFLSCPGTFAATSKCDCVTLKPASVFSIVIVAVVATDSGVMPALPSSAENAIEKHPACAAAISSSGFVPTPF